MTEFDSGLVIANNLPFDCQGGVMKHHWGVVLL